MRQPLPLHPAADYLFLVRSLCHAVLYGSVRSAVDGLPTAISPMRADDTTSRIISAISHHRFVLCLTMSWQSFGALAQSGFCQRKRALLFRCACPSPKLHRHARPAAPGRGRPGSHRARFTRQSKLRSLPRIESRHRLQRISRSSAFHAPSGNQSRRLRARLGALPVQCVEANRSSQSDLQLVG